MKWHLEKRKINELKVWDKNPRIIKENNYERLKRNVSELGNFEPLVCDIDGTILAGNQRYKVAQEQELGEIDVYLPERKLTDKERKKIGVLSNRHEGEWDFDILANEFEEELLKETGFDNLPNLDFKIKEKEFNSEKDLETENKCPKCGYEW